MSNHLSLNLVTKGLLNISNITKGMIILQYQVIFKKKKHGGGGTGDGLYKPPLYYDSKEPLFREIKEEYNDIDVIKVYVDWNKYNSKEYIKIEAVKLKNQMEAEILNETGKYIKVEII